MKRNGYFHFPITFILLLLVGCAGNVESRKLLPIECIDFQIVEDRKDTQIRASVKVDVTEQELQCVLTQIADTHQFDNDRDYLTSDYLWVVVYLNRDGKLSKVPAATVRRTVPFDKSQTEYSEKANRFNFNLTDAQASF